MPTAATKLMTVDEFLQWQRTRDDRYELVEGVPLKLMTGASTQHDRITSNVLIDLGNQLDGSPCWPATADVGIRTKIRSLRRADILVTCDEPQPDVYEAQTPKMVVEVLSPSNKGLGWQRKIEEYRQHPLLAYMLLIDSEQAQATLVARDGERWLPTDYDGLEGTIELPAIACRLDMGRIYRGIVFTADIRDADPS